MKNTKVETVFTCSRCGFEVTIKAETCLGMYPHTEHPKGWSDVTVYGENHSHVYADLCPTCTVGVSEAIQKLLPGEANRVRLWVDVRALTTAIINSSLDAEHAFPIAEAAGLRGESALYEQKWVAKQK